MKIFRAVLAAALCLTVFSGCGPNAENTKPASDDKAFLTITDDTGRTVVLPEKPERVVSLATSYLNMIDAVGGKIVGRASSKIGEMPETMKNVPEVGFVYNINMESLIGLKPDLVIANKNQHEKFLPLLESNKIPVIAINPKTYDEVKDKLILMGKIYGVPEKGEAAAAKLDQQVKAVTEKLPKDGKRIVIMHATPSNVTVELENSIAGCVAKEIENRLRADVKSNPAWASLEAVRNNKVYLLPERLFLLNPGLHYPDAVKYMAKTVYPEVFKDDK